MVAQVLLVLFAIAALLLYVAELFRLHDFFGGRHNHGVQVLLPGVDFPGSWRRLQHLRLDAKASIVNWSHEDYQFDRCVRGRATDRGFGLLSFRRNCWQVVRIRHGVYFGWPGVFGEFPPRDFRSAGMGSDITSAMTM